MWLLVISVAFVFGIALAGRYPVAIPAASGLLVVAALGALLLRRHAASLVMLGCALAIVSAGARYMDSLPPDGPEAVGFHNGSGEMKLRGAVVEESTPKGAYSEMVVDRLTLNSADGELDVAGKVLVRTREPWKYRYGEVLRLRGELETPATLQEFDYPGYLARRGIYSTMFCPDIEPTGETAGAGVLIHLNRLRSGLSGGLASSLHEPQASLAQALLLGERSSLPQQTTDAFARSGAAHLLAVSGLHLGIIILSVVALALAILGRQRYLYVWVALGVVWSYAALTGLRPPVVRAAIMASMFLFAELAGRQKHAPTALAFAAALMVAVHPQTLWGVSFQLSVLAMGGLVAFYRPIREAFDRFVVLLRPGSLQRLLPQRVRDIAAATIAATIAVWPLGAATFGIVPLVGLPVSLLTLPVLPFAIGASAIVALIASLFPVLAAPSAWLAWLVLSYVHGIVDLFAGLPFAAFPMDPASPVLLLYYASLGVAAAWFMRPRVAPERPREPAARPLSRWSLLSRLAVIPLAIAAGLVWSAVAASPDGRLHVAFLDVGQGDAALITSPSGRNVLIDGGPDGVCTMSTLGRLMPFYERDVDLIIATQPHADHLSGLLDVVERMNVGLVAHGDGDYDSLVSDVWSYALAGEHMRTCCPQCGDFVDLGDGTVVEFLGPRPEGYSGSSDDTDNNGLVARVCYGDVSFLFMADVRTDVERDMVRRGVAPESTVLKIGHHGSSTSSCPQFLSAVSPELAVISVGAENEYGHPHEAVTSGLREQGIPFLTTAAHGTIECTTDGKSVWVVTGV